MRISALAAAADLPLATVKYYLREGLLHPGTATSATQASYDETHVRRIRLIRALTGPVGLSVQQARTILDLIDDPGDDLYATLGRAVGALPPPVDAASVDDPDPYPRARAALEALGQVYDPQFAAVAQLEAALAATEAAGMPLSDDRLLEYGAACASSPPSTSSGCPRSRTPPSSTRCSAPRCTSPSSSRSAGSRTRTSPRAATSAG